MNESRRRPEESWAPLYSGPVEALPAEALAAAERILRLLPQLERLTLMTTDGPVSLERRPSGAAWRAADEAALELLACTPAITGIVANAFDARDGVRRACPEDPFLTRDGGRTAAIRASVRLGEITTEEAERQQRELLAGRDTEDPLEELWDASPVGSDRAV
ncbi:MULTISPECIES: hypothetical protein [unclassified Rathayibacter]|uniref:hypothetical protein n=1 Tax=unclassified Rathayibacter TaxID=2609250 RepID=UPI00188D80BE|nr:MULTISPECIES: hypothetical protein [unclassified Rathayibacter]MBF4461186.1 hypothetical protein [Rathayibacter sp. VKM Ac-2879]MBF4502597.1 hypothetical protein [Rathayibacter sp. VKM Ac-2878]